MALNYNGLYLDEEPYLSNDYFNGKEEWKNLMEKMELCSVAIHATIYENYGNLTSRFKEKCPRYKSSQMHMVTKIFFEFFDYIRNNSNREKFVSWNPVFDLTLTLKVNKHVIKQDIHWTSLQLAGLIFQMSLRKPNLE